MSCEKIYSLGYAMKKQKVAFVLVLILAMAFCVTLAGCMQQSGNQADGESIVKYTMYIGLSDKDAYTQLIPYEEAEKKVSGIALKYVDGFTQLAAKGAYKDEKGVVTHENSLVLEISHATDEQIKAIMNEVLKELNQNSILIEKEYVNCEFYEGEKP